MITEAILFIIFFIVVYTLWNQGPSDLPPGPLRIPIIGGGRPNNDLRCKQLQKKYGDLIMEKVGKFYWLTICDYKLCKEVMAKTEVADRPELILFNDLNGGKALGIGGTNGEHWKTNRRFVMQYLRDNGMGKSFLEDSIQEEAKEIVAEFNRRAGTNTEVTFLNFASLNVIWQMVARKRYDVNDPMLDKMQRLNQKVVKSIGLLVFLCFIPTLYKLIPNIVAYHFLGRKALLTFFDQLKSTIQPVIDEHRKNLDRENPKDLIDLYTLEMENPVQLTKENVSDSDLRAITIDMFNAGSDTVAITLRWAIFYLTKYPHIQTKMQEELDSIVPRDMLPGYEHKSQLPYCEAVTHEILRKSSLANFGGIRSTNEEFTLGGYRIPKDTVITPANFLIHHDPRYWRNPEQFDPERFLDENGKFRSPKEGFLAFGSGKRQCPGEGLARSELYIFLTAIFQNFSFLPVEGKEIDIGVSNKSIGTHLPVNQEIFVQSRRK